MRSGLGGGVATCAGRGRCWCCGEGAPAAFRRGTVVRARSTAGFRDVGQIVRSRPDFDRQGVKNIASRGGLSKAELTCDPLALHSDACWKMMIRTRTRLVDCWPPHRCTIDIDAHSLSEYRSRSCRRSPGRRRRRQSWCGAGVGIEGRNAYQRCTPVSVLSQP